MIKVGSRTNAWNRKCPLERVSRKEESDHGTFFRECSSPLHHGQQGDYARFKDDPNPDLDALILAGKMRFRAQDCQDAPFESQTSHQDRISFSFILLIHEGSHREVYQEFQPSYDIIRRWCQGLFRPQVPCTASLHSPIASSASTQSQQPV